jgi:hypothetical protein
MDSIECLSDFGNSVACHLAIASHAENSFKLATHLDRENLVWTLYLALACFLLLSPDRTTCAAMARHDCDIAFLRYCRNFLLLLGATFLATEKILRI